MFNSEIRAKAVSAGVKQWEIADRIGVSESTFTRMMRHPVDRDTRQRILDAIRDIRAERGGK